MSGVSRALVAPSAGETNRTRVEIDPQQRNVTLIIDGHQWVFSVGTMEPTPSLVFLRQLAQAATLAEAALRVARDEHARTLARQASTDLPAPSLSACSLCRRGRYRDGVCGWCGNPEPASGEAAQP